jgi:hypothetical protein
MVEESTAILGALSRPTLNDFGRHRRQLAVDAIPSGDRDLTMGMTWDFMILLGKTSMFNGIQP